MKKYYLLLLMCLLVCPINSSAAAMKPTRATFKQSTNLIKTIESQKVNIKNVKVPHRVTHSTSLMNRGSTLESEFTTAELQLLYKVVQAEVGDYSFQQKKNVASVIFNRYKSSRFQGSLTDILLAKGQFSVVSNGRYKKVRVDQDTIDACEAAWSGSDSTGGALFFESQKSNRHSNYASFTHNDNAHKFYK